MKDIDRKFAVILSGCGGMDGSETHEAVSLMIAIKQVGANYTCFSIDERQKYVIHTNANSSFGLQQLNNETRNMLVESGRLNHGVVYDLKKLDVDNFDALIFPGGYGTGTSFSNFITCNGERCDKHVDYTVRDEIKDLIIAFHKKKKPIFAGCLAHVLVNGSLTGIKVMMDVGKYTADAVERKGNSYEITTARNICVDEENKIITAPFYLTPKVSVDTIYQESVKAIDAILKLCD